MSILNEEELVTRVQAAKSAGARVGFTCGAFDLLHPGHLRYLWKARKACDLLFAALNDDESVARLKGPGLPLRSIEERLEILAAMRCVDGVTIMSDDRPARLIERLSPDFYFKGGDYEASQLKSASVVERGGGEAVVIDVGRDDSSRFIRSRLVDLSEDEEFADWLRERSEP